MEDDIDIEEHDLMDNPRIKSIFPDLSCVKIEIPDDEEFEEHYDDEPGDTDGTEHSPQDMVYQYEYNFEPNEIVPETCSAYQETNYVYNNQIILGSKPPADPEILYEEALNSHPIVYLENWETRLGSSPCFCRTCNILFPTVNALDAHKMISHSYLVALDTSQKNTARKSTVTSKFCNHCSRMFPDDTSLIKHLYELLPLNNFPKAKEEKTEQDSREHNCSKCKNTYPNIAALRWHEKTNHPTSNVNIRPKKVKIVTKANKIEVGKKVVVPKKTEVGKKIEVGKKTEVAKKTEVGKKFEVKGKSALKKINKEGKFFCSSLVPKSTLFQCRVCQVCFLSCFSAIQHTKVCGKALQSQKCGVCKRKIRSKDVEMHELQHTYAEKLRIYTVYKNIYEKVLCRCPKCLACFDELGFWAHYKLCKKHEKRSYCSDCDVHIAANRYESHRTKHSIKKFTKKDFIIIEFHDQNVKNVDARIEAIKTKRLKERRRVKGKLRKSKDKEIHLYYCDSCGCCLYKLQFKGHINGYCKGGVHNKKICEDCGLCFTTKSMESHIIRHKKRAFTLKDIKFFNLFTGDQIDPPMTDSYKCKSCDLHFLYQRLVKHHNCETEEYETCKICSKKFNLQAYKVHKLFHSDDNDADTFMPELIEKYKSINNTWSVIYMCTACDLVTMTYDSVVTHCQRHLNNINSDNRKCCAVCDLQIAECDFANHDLLHRNNASIERASFKILVYNYEELFKKEWMTLFRPLPKQHRQQILSNSIYRYTRSVKMQLEKTGATDEINYICMVCKSSVEGTSIVSHLKIKCELNNKFNCRTCNGVSKTLKNFISHHCKDETVTVRSTIVSFNNECDKKFDNRLRAIESRSKPTKPTTLPPVLPDIKKSYIIYKCSKCKVCVNLKSSIKRHHCVAQADKTYCRICQQYITSKKIRNHTEAHRKKPYVNKNTLSVVYFTNDEKMARKSTVTAKIFKCQCRLHFTSLKSIHTHMDICKPDLEISKEVCSKCNLLFPTDVLVTHLVNHHSKEVEIDIETILRVNLYKCSTCYILFTTQSNFNEHMYNCDPKNGSLCLDCKLNFGKKCLAKHKCSAKGTHLNKIIIMKKTVQLTTVFQCESCEICYLNYKSFQYHLNEVNHTIKTALVTCDSCGLRFTSNSSHKHEKSHTFGDAYKIKVINPISGDSVIISGHKKAIVFRPHRGNGN